MNDKNNVSTIHDFDFDLICQYFLTLDRQGPGSAEATLKALSFIGGLDAQSRIADLGCGTGGQTMTLAQATTGHITGIDLFPKFIDRFNERHFRPGVQGVVGSMDALPFGPQSLDLIWCEGAIYNLGFERALRYWRDFLKPGGYVAVTENTWPAGEHPREVEEFWAEAYPEIDTVAAKIGVMQSAGYEFVAAFELGEKPWRDFYESQEPSMRVFRQRGGADTFLDCMVRERALYEKYDRPWSYVFYIGRRIW